MIEYKAYRDSDGIWVPFFKNKRRKKKKMSIKEKEN